MEKVVTAQGTVDTKLVGFDSLHRPSGVRTPAQVSRTCW
jgi:hypothetical protein